MSRPVLPNSAAAVMRDLEKRIARLERRGGGGGGSGGSLPAGGVAEDILVKQSSTNGDADWETIAESGYSLRFGEAVNIDGVQDLLDYIFDIGYSAPSVTTPTTSLGISEFEEGTTVFTDYTVSCTTTMGSDTITAVQFQYNTGSGWTNIGGSTPAHPTGGVETSATVTADITTQIQFRVQVTDASPNTITSGVRTIEENFPIYYGAGAAGLNAAGIEALSGKDITRSSRPNNVTYNYGDPAAEKLYLAYPNSYGSESSALDKNGFENFGGFTARTVTSHGVTYKVYESNVVTTQTAWTLKWS